MKRKRLHSALHFYALTTLFYLCAQLAYGQSAQEHLKIDSIKRIIKSNVHDTTKIKAIRDWDGIIFRYDPELDLKLNQRIDSICSANLKLSKNQDERNFYLKASASAKNVMGLIHKDWGNFAQSLKYYLKAEEIFTFLEDIRSLAGVQSNIGVVYTRQNKQKRAREYYNQSLEKYISLLDTTGMARTYQNIGLSYKMDSNYNKAIENYQMGLELYNKIRHRFGTAQMYNNLSAVYITQKQFDLAEMYIDSAIILKEDVGGEVSIALSLNNKSELLFLTGRLDKAKKLTHKAIEIGLKHDNKEVLLDAYDNLYQIYEKRGMYKQALEAYIDRQDITNYLENTEKTRQITSLELQSRYREKSVQDSLKNLHIRQQKDLEIEAHRAESEKRRLQQYYLIGAGGLAVVFGFMMFRRFRVSQRQKAIIQSQKEQVEEKNREVLSSITYAKRLQEAILPSKDYIDKQFEDYFIFYQPKDIVAGDFYWVENIERILYVATADCTGHGVPGAMVSVVCSNALSKAVIEEHLTSPAQILNRARELVIERFERSHKVVMDGMDISFCAIDHSKGELKWSGANLPLWYIKKDVNGKNRTMEVIMANKQPVGKYELMEPFSEHTLKLSEIETIYMFSDGFADQFGGPRRKKFYSENFKKLLLSLDDKKMVIRGEKVEEAFLNWKGDNEQIDDICVIGIRL